MTNLDNNIKFLPGIGEKRAQLIGKELGLHTLRDVLHYFPFRYIDRSKILKIGEIDPESNSYVQIRARIDGLQSLGGGAKTRLVAQVSDGRHTAEMVWFKGLAWVQKQIEVGREYIFFGKPNFFNGRVSFVHPEIETIINYKEKFSKGVQGIYSTTEKLNTQHITSKTIYSMVCNAWQMVSGNITEIMPEHVRRQYGLIGLREAIFGIHFPTSEAQLKQASLRLKFDELIGVQLNILSQRNIRIARNKGHVFAAVGDVFHKFYNERLPFELTGAQKRVIKEIRADMATGRQMNRLLQGDVGSGKTLVALMCMLIAIGNGTQACIMAPTEILANQHYESIAGLLGDMGLRVGLLCGSTKKSVRKVLLPALENGEVDILIGTHALIEDNVVFNKLGMVVIDEQHRFGVEQRAKLWRKGDILPHVLVMTATPIPRTLAMTLYGDLDVSVIDELPAGRKPIRTIHFYESHRLRMLGLIRDEIAKGRQVYIVYPLIKESEKMDYRDLEDGYAGITAAFPPPKYVTMVVHGKMKQADKDYGMEMFAGGKAQILMATSVIEVGVNVPNASVMIIESAERFGLSQLHQLRGRVGRGSEQSYCVLMTSVKLSKESRQRLSAMVATTDGFELAELDLRLRGPGDLQGTMQSGLAFDLKIANLAQDGQIIAIARDAAENILDKDPSLSLPENSGLKELKKRYGGEQANFDFSMIS